jgi:murein DD-endopeptidase MepM/ murein hydrolase activator NlpD
LPREEELMRHVLLAAVLAAVPPFTMPADGPVELPFAEPAGEYGPGHRGVDLRVPPGSPVRAVASGRVAFAGPVAGARHVVVDHGDGLRSSYSYLQAVSVEAGAPVRGGEVLGKSGGEGPGHSPEVFHFGVRLQGRYVDPARYLPVARPRIRLAPVGDGPAGTCERVAAVH